MRRFLTLPSGLKRSDTSTASLGALSRSLQTFEPVPSGLILTDEQQEHVQHLQTQLNALYEELDLLLIQEETLVSRGYARRRARLQADSDGNKSHYSNPAIGTIISGTHLSEHAHSPAPVSRSRSCSDASSLRRPPRASNTSLNSTQSSDQIDTIANDSNCSTGLSASLPDLIAVPFPRSRLASLVDPHDPSLPVATVRPLNAKSETQMNQKNGFDPANFERFSDWNDASDAFQSHEFQSSTVNLSHFKRIANDSNAIDDDERQSRQLQRREMEIDSLQHVMSEQKQQSQRLQAQHSELRLQLKDSEQQRQQLLRELRRTRLALDNSEEQKQQMVAQLQNSCSNTLQLQQQCDTLKQELVAQQSSLDQLQQSLKHCEQSRSELHAQSEQFRLDLSSERDKFIRFLMDESRSSEQQLQRQLDEKNVQAQQLRKQLTEARAEANLLQQRFGGRSAQLQMQNAALIEQLAQLRQALGQRMHDQSEVQQQQKLAETSMDADLSQSARQLTYGVERMQQILLEAQLNSEQNVDARTSETHLKQQQYLQQLERLVMRNMRSVIDLQLNSRFEKLEQSLATVKFEVIEGALKQDARVNGAGGVGGSGWACWITSTDLNNNGAEMQQNAGQLKVVQKKMVELRKSVETYLRSYFVRILMELQEQQIPTSKSKGRA
jgi:myosin heavy subunit